MSYGEPSPSPSLPARVTGCVIVLASVQVLHKRAGEKRLPVQTAHKLGGLEADGPTF